MSKRHPQQANKHGKHHDGDDAFVASVMDLSTWTKANQNLVTLGGIAVLVLILGGWYWLNFNRNLEDRALVELEQIQQTLALGDVETGKVSLSQFIEQFGGTAAAPEASLMLAQLYLETAQPAQAIQALDASGIGRRDPLGPQAFILRARAHETQGQLAEAETTYLEVAEFAELPFQRIEALADAARMRMEQGDDAGAITIYDEILAEMEPNDPARGEYEMRRAEMQARQIG